MHRRKLLQMLSGAAVTSRALRAAPVVEDDLRITGVRLVNMRPKRPVAAFEPAPGAWSAGGVEVANPVSIYPKYKPRRSLFFADGPRARSFWVEIDTNKGVKGYGPGGPGGGVIVEDHLARLLMGENPLDIERLWDILWRSTMSYGRKGVTVNAISGVDIALWDIAGKVLDAPVWRLLGGRIHPRIPCYCTGNDIEQHVEFGYKRPEAGASVRPGGRPPWDPQERRAGPARPRGRGPGWGRDDGLLDGAHGAVHAGACRGVRAVQRVLARRGPATRRFRRLRTAAAADHVDPHRHG